MDIEQHLMLVFSFLISVDLIYLSSSFLDLCMSHVSLFLHWSKKKTTKKKKSYCTVVEEEQQTNLNDNHLDGVCEGEEKKKADDAEERRMEIITRRRKRIRDSRKQDIIIDTSFFRQQTLTKSPRSHLSSNYIHLSFQIFLLVFIVSIFIQLTIEF